MRLGPTSVNFTTSYDCSWNITPGYRFVRENAHDFALRGFNAWGVGQRGVDNGMPPFFAIDDRRVEIIPGGREVTLGITGNDRAPERFVHQGSGARCESSGRT